MNMLSRGSSRQWTTRSRVSGARVSSSLRFPAVAAAFPRSDMILLGLRGGNSGGAGKMVIRRLESYRKCDLQSTLLLKTNKISTNNNIHSSLATRSISVNCSNGGDRTINNSNPRNHSNSSSAPLDIIEKELLLPSQANADTLLAAYRSLFMNNNQESSSNSSSKEFLLLPPSLLPVSQLERTLDMLVKRHDAMRLEILLQMVNKTKNKNTKKSVTSASTATAAGFEQEKEEQVCSQLIRRVISGMLGQGDIQQALVLWVRMAHSGFVSDEALVNCILQQVADSGGDGGGGDKYYNHTGFNHMNATRNGNILPPVAFLDKLHSMSSSYRLNSGTLTATSSPPPPFAYYLQLFRVYERLISSPSSCCSLPELDLLCGKFAKLWDELNATTANSTTPASPPLSVEAHSARVLVYTAAAAACSRLTSNAEHVGVYNAQCLLAFKAALVLTCSRPSSPPSPLSSSSLLPLETVQRVLTVLASNGQSQHVLELTSSVLKLYSNTLTPPPPPVSAGGSSCPPRAVSPSATTSSNGSGSSSSSSRSSKVSSQLRASADPATAASVQQDIVSALTKKIDAMSNSEGTYTHNNYTSTSTSTNTINSGINKCLATLFSSIIGHANITQEALSTDISISSSSSSSSSSLSPFAPLLAFSRDLTQLALNGGGGGGGAAALDLTSSAQYTANLIRALSANAAALRQKAYGPLTDGPDRHRIMRSSVFEPFLLPLQKADIGSAGRFMHGGEKKYKDKYNKLSSSSSSSIGSNSKSKSKSSGKEQSLVDDSLFGGAKSTANINNNNNNNYNDSSSSSSLLSKLSNSKLVSSLGLGALFASSNNSNSGNSRATGSTSSAVVTSSRGESPPYLPVDRAALQHLVQQHCLWPQLLDKAFQITDACDDSVGRSGAVYEALIDLLCSFANEPDCFVNSSRDTGLEERTGSSSLSSSLSSSTSSSSASGAIFRSLALVKEMGREGCAVTPQLLSRILTSATLCMQDEQLEEVLHFVRTLIEEPLSLSLAAVLSAKKKNSRKTDPSIAETADSSEEEEAEFIAAQQFHTDAMCASLKAQMLANARLGHGYMALELLQKLRKLGYEGLTVRDYDWVLLGLYKSPMESYRDKCMAQDPSTTCQFLMREMSRDGLRVNSRTLVALLRLHTKAAQIAAHSSSSSSSSGMTTTQSNTGSSSTSRTSAALAVVDVAELFVRDCASGKYSPAGGPPVKVKLDSRVISELVKMCCIVGSEERALQLLQTTEAVFGVPLSVECYEPVLFNYAVLRGAGNATEDVYMDMINHGISPNDAVVDSLVLGSIRNGDLSEATERIQDLFNQHGCRPSATVTLRLLDAALQSGALFAARNIVSLIKRIYTDEERLCAVGYYYNTTGSSSSYNSSGDDDDDDDMVGHEAADMWAYRAAAASEREGAENGKAKTVAAAAAAVIDEEEEEENDSNGCLPPGRLIKYVIPLGHKVRGVLSNAALEQRFADYNCDYNLSAAAGAAVVAAPTATTATSTAKGHNEGSNRKHGKK